MEQKEMKNSNPRRKAEIITGILLTAAVAAAVIFEIREMLQIKDQSFAWNLSSLTEPGAALAAGRVSGPGMQRFLTVAVFLFLCGLQRIFAGELLQSRWKANVWTVLWLLASFFGYGSRYSPDAGLFICLFQRHVLLRDGAVPLLLYLLMRFQRLPEICTGKTRRHTENLIIAAVLELAIIFSLSGEGGAFCGIALFGGFAVHQFLGQTGGQEKDKDKTAGILSLLCILPELLSLGAGLLLGKREPFILYTVSGTDSYTDLKSGISHIWLLKQELLRFSGDGKKIPMVGFFILFLLAAETVVGKKREAEKKTFAATIFWEVGILLLILLLNPFREADAYPDLLAGIPTAALFATGAMEMVSFPWMVRRKREAERPNGWEDVKPGSGICFFTGIFTAVCLIFIFRSVAYPAKLIAEDREKTQELESLVTEIREMDPEAVTAGVPEAEAVTEAGGPDLKWTDLNHVLQFTDTGDNISALKYQLTGFSGEVPDYAYLFRKAGDRDAGFVIADYSKTLQPETLRGTGYGFYDRTEHYSLYYQGGWTETEEGWKYRDYRGDDYGPGWHLIGGLWYMLDENGVIRTGFQDIDGKTYYFTSGGVMTMGWYQIDGAWYYFDPDGEMRRNCEVDGYTLDRDGKMQEQKQE